MVVEKGLEKNRICATIEKTGHLLGKNRGTIYSPCLRFICSDSQWADAARHTNIFSTPSLFRETGGSGIDFACLLTKTKTFQPHRVRAKRIRFNHPRARCDVRVVNFAHPLRLTQAKLLQAAFKRDAFFEQHCAHRTVTADQVAL